MCNNHSNISMPFCNISLWHHFWNFKNQPNIEIDECLAETIKRMNTIEGIQTIDCCCRHGDPDGYIILIDSHSVYNAIKAGYNVMVDNVDYYEDETYYEQPWYKGGQNSFNKEYLIIGKDNVP